MPVVNPGEVWMIDFGITAKVRPALLLSDAPIDDGLDIVTVLLHATALIVTLRLPAAHLISRALTTKLRLSSDSR